MASEALGLLETKGLVALMEGTDAMLKAGCAGDCPGPRQRLRVALVREEPLGVGFKFHGDRGNFFGGGNAPGLRAVG